MPPRKVDKKTGKKQLTLREQALAEKQIANLASGKKKSVTQLAKEAGYSEKSAYELGSKTLNRVEVKEYVQERVLGVLKADADEVLGLLALHLRADVGDFGEDAFDEAGKLDVKALKSKGLSRLIKKIKVKTSFDREGGKEITTDLEIHDSQAAAAKLLDVLGLKKAPEANPEDAERSERLIRAIEWLKLSKGYTEEQAKLHAPMLVESKLVS